MARPFLRFPPALALALVLGPGCAAPAFDRAADRDSEAAYRRFLGRHAEGPEARRARERLESLAFRRARAADDVAGYNRFLAEFPEGEFAGEARQQRAWARLRRALAAGGAEPLRRVVEEDEGTEAGARALARLGELEAARARSAESAAELRAYLLSFPEADDRAAVERRLDTLEFEAAREARSAERLGAYLEAHPRGMHRAQAEDLVEDLLAEEAIASGQIEPMEAFLRQHPGAVSAGAVSRAVAARLVERSRLTLDPEPAVEALAVDPDGPLASEAGRLARDLEAGGARLRRLKGLLAELTAPLPVRPVEELRRALSSPDPRDGWYAVRETVFSAEPEAVDVAVEAAGRPDPLLVQYARAALSGWAGRASGRRHLERWADRLRTRASNPEDMLRLGAVSEALGDRGAALAAYRTAAESRETALAGASIATLLAASDGSPSELRGLLDRLVELARARVEELAELAPERVDEESLDQAVLIRRRLDGLERVLAGVLERLAGEGAREETVARRDDLERVRQALVAAGRRLEARIGLVDGVAAGETGDPLAALGASHIASRVEAAVLLGRSRAPEVVPALVQVARSERGEVGRAALRALGGMPLGEARRGLIELSLEGDGLGPELVSALRQAASRAPVPERAELEAAASSLARGAGAP